MGTISVKNIAGTAGDLRTLEAKFTSSTGAPIAGKPIVAPINHPL